jgi:hypothetical protein
MQSGPWLIFLLSAYPLCRAWRANRNTSLFQAVHWAMAAWVAWGGAMYVAMMSGRAETHPVAAYVALCLTGCAGVAVLGARRPGAGAWNFVVVGLLAVMSLPLVESAFIQKPLLDPLRIGFLAATIAVGMLNFLPTRLAPVAVLVASSSAIHLLLLTGEAEQGADLAWWLLALAPWLAFFLWLLPPPPDSEFDRIWLNFRDRFGFLWGQRMREQFNRSAASAGWPVILRWHGLRLLAGAEIPDAAAQTAIVETLRALLKRFGDDEEEASEDEGEVEN